MSLLPDGSQLKGVMLPRYDEHQILSGLLKADTMTLVDAEKIAGSNVTLESYNPDSSQRGQVNLQNAIFYKEKNLIVAQENVTIVSDQLTARGSGITFSIDTNEGFLSGPATTSITQAPTETVMQTPAQKLRATALAGIALVAAPLTAAPPPSVTAAEQAALKADAGSKAATLAEANAGTGLALAESNAISAAADAAAGAFLAGANIPQPAVDTPAAKPLEIAPTPTQTTITCEGGVYFDAAAGLLVYSKNVVVTDPRFDLTGVQELKVFLGKKPTATEKAVDKKPLAGMGASFGAVERILATGTVRILQKATEEGKAPIEASGAIFNYNVASGEIIISGGYPWVLQGANFLRASRPNLNLRIQKSGSFATEGDWKMGGELTQKK